MSISDRIYYILADGTPQQAQLEALAGRPSTSLIPTRCEDSATIDEYVSGISLDQPSSSFQQRLAIYGDTPVSTFSILA